MIDLERVTNLTARLKKWDSINDQDMVDNKKIFLAEAIIGQASVDEICRIVELIKADRKQPILIRADSHRAVIIPDTDGIYCSITKEACNYCTAFCESRRAKR